MRFLLSLLLLATPASGTLLSQDVPTLLVDAPEAPSSQNSLGWIILTGYGSILTPFNLFVDIPSGSFLVPAVANLQVVRIFQSPNDPGIEEIGNLNFLGQVVMLSSQGNPVDNSGPSMNTLYLANGSAPSLSSFLENNGTEPQPTPAEEVIAVVIPNFNVPGPNVLSTTAPTSTLPVVPIDSPTQSPTTPTAVELPEPSTWSLLGIGSTLLLALSRRNASAARQTESCA